MIKKRIASVLKYSLIGIFWIAVWFLLAKRVGEELLLPSPTSVGKRLCELMLTSDFYLASLGSLSRIAGGALSGIILGALFALVTSVIKPLGELLAPLFAVIKSTPVASFIMLAMLWIEKDILPSFITFLIVFPVALANISSGIKSTPKELIELASLHKMPRRSRVIHIYLPSLVPFLASTAKSALGLAWKAGIAAEVLSVPKRAIGSAIYESKIFFETTDLFAWTLVTVVLSILMEFAVGGLLSQLAKKYEYRRGGETNVD